MSERASQTFETQARSIPILADEAGTPGRRLVTKNSRNLVVDALIFTIALENEKGLKLMVNRNYITGTL